MKKITSLFLVLNLSTSFTFAKIVYVNQLSGSDTNDGTNWAKAYKTLSYANNSLRTTTGDSIWVAGGATYILSAASANTSANSNSFYQNNKNWFGGFFGNESTLNQRPLSDRDGNGITESWEFLYPTVLSISLTDATAIVFGAGDFNGFTLTANATYTSRYNYVYALNASTRFLNNTIKNCIVTLTMATTVNETYNPFFKARGTIDNCIFEKNEITVNAKNSYCYPFINIENSAAITSGTLFTNNIVRNNKIRIDYTTSTANSNSSIRGLILNIIPAIQSSGLNTTIANCCIHNNEMIYVPSVGNTSGAMLTNGATISVNTQNLTACNDSIINCTIANNKGTKIKTGGIYIGFDAVSYHYIINNVFYNNQNSSDGSTFYIDNMSGSITANVGIISNNFTNGGGLINTANKIYNQDNTLNINSPVFLSPTMVSGNTSDNSTELSNWAIGPSSYLIGKGTSVNGRLTDKSGKIFQNPRTIGAYEFYMNCMVSASTLTSGGTIVSGVGNYNYGSTVTLIAQPNPGFHFIGWIENTTLVSTNSTYSFNITGNRTFTASFLSNNVSIQSGITNISSYPNCESCSVELSGTGTMLEINENTSLNSLIVNPGSKVTLNNGKTLNLSSLLLRSDITGNATFVDNGSANINTATVQQFLSSGRNWYIASPVNSAIASNLSSSASVVCYNEPSSTWLPVAGNSELIPGKGYISVGTNNTDIVTFSGTLNTGNISVPLTRSSGITNEGFNLIGNPYASYLDFTKVDTTTANILPTIWYRTKNLTSNSYVFDTYNGLANIGTSNGSLTVTNLIPPMQAFWVRVKPAYNSGTLTFNNGMRTHMDVLTNRLKFPKQNELKQSVLRLKVFKGQLSDESIIAFNELAKDDYDDYDSPKMMSVGSTQPEIYTTIGNEMLTINSKKNCKTDLNIPIGFKTGETGTYTLKLEDSKNFSPETRFFLKDNNLNLEQDITNNGEYTFSSGAINTTSRFSVIFKSSSVSTQINNHLRSRINILTDEKKQIIIINNSGNLAEIIVTNVLGEHILKSTLNEGNNIYNLNKGIFLVTISQESDIYTQKVVVK